MQFQFPSLRLIRTVLASNVLPRTALKVPVRVSRLPQHHPHQTGDESESSIVVEWPRGLSQKVVKQLRHFGVEYLDTPRSLPHQLNSILQSLPLETSEAYRIPQGEPVLLELPDAAWLDRFVTLALRLGRYELGVQRLESPGTASSATTDSDAGGGRHPDTYLLRIDNPPYYLILQALEASEEGEEGEEGEAAGASPPVGIFRQMGGGVWVAAGYAHPFANNAPLPAGQMLLIDERNEWRLVAKAFTDVASQVDLVVPASLRPLKVRESPERFRVELQLSRNESAQTPPPQLWVVDGSQDEQLDELVASLDAPSLERLLFAVGEAGGQRSYVLRLRSTREESLELPIEAIRCRTYLNLPYLFVPCEYILHPPLRRDVLARHFSKLVQSVDKDAICWLVPESEGEFHVEMLRETAFQPLSEWVDYVIDRDRKILEHWVKSTTFEFESWVVAEPQEEAVLAPATDLPASDLPAVGRQAGEIAGFARAEVPSNTGETRVAESDETVLRAEAISPSQSSRDQAETDRSVTAPAGTDYGGREADAEHAGSSSAEIGEQAVLERTIADRLLAGTPTDQALPGQLLELADRYASQRRYADSLLCCLQVAWETPGGERELAERWWAWEQKRRGVSWDEGLDNWPERMASAADHDAAHAWASLLLKLESDLGTGKPTAGELQRLHKWMAAVNGDFLSAAATHLERVEDQLPIRARWLAWKALARLAGQDALLLARARDRVLARLSAEGLRPQLDLPSFMRGVIGTANALAAEEVHAAERGSEHAGQVGKFAAQLFPQVLTWLEDPPANPDARTRVYAKWLFAWALHQLGEEQRGEQLAREAEQQLPADEVHQWLARAWQQRLQEAAQGLVFHHPLTPQLYRELDAMDRMDRFKIERYLEHSAILLPRLQRDPFERWSSNTKWPWSEEVREWSGEASVTVLERRVADTWAEYEGTAEGESRRGLLLACLGASFRLGSSTAAAFLQRAARAEVPKADLYTRLRLLEVSLRLSADFALPDLFDRFLNDLKQALGPWVERLSTALPLEAEALAQLLSRALLDVIRMGRDEDAASFPEYIEFEVTPRLMHVIDRSPETDFASRVSAAILLLEVASCQWFQGEDEQAGRITERIEPMLRSQDLEPHDAAVLARSWARAFRYAPLDVVAERYREVFGTDSRGRRTYFLHLRDEFVTSSHFSLSQLGLIEGVVTTLAGPRLQLNPVVRSWIERDEVEILRRVHQDLETLVRASPLTTN